MSLLSKIRERMAAVHLKREVCFDGEGFVITSTTSAPISVRWADVQEVCGFKRDLFSIDEICLGFDLGLDRFVWAGEEDDGFEQFRGEVEGRFGFDATWFGLVMKPAFAENLTTLWQADRKKPNKAPEPTPTSVTPPANVPKSE